MLGSMNISWSN